MGKLARPLATEKVRLVQVARRRLNLQEDDYRSLLMRAGGVSSCTHLSEAGFRQLMEMFAYLGFQSTSAVSNFRRREGFATSGEVAAIRRLWREYTAGEGKAANLDKWLESTFHVSALRFLPAEKGPKAIAALRAMQRRRSVSKAQDASLTGI